MAKGQQFWSSPQVDPKRSFRYILILNNIPTFFVRTSGKPSFAISNIPHQYMQHTFNFPGKMTWNTISVTLVDPVIPDATAKVIKILQASGYAIPGTDSEARISFTKREATAALGTPQISQLDAKGREIEKWTLINAWIESAKFGDLSYSDEKMLEITMVLRYDFATYSGAPASLDNPVPRPILDGGDNQFEKIAEYQKELGKI